MNETLEKLEATLDRAIAQIEQLASENAALKRELVDAQSRMSQASVRLHALAERFPSLSDASKAQPMQ